MTTLPAHLFVSSVDGALYDTRDPDWSRKTPLRASYYGAGRVLATLGAVKAALRAGQYTDLGCYPLYFLTDDGAALSFDSVRREWRQIVWDFLNDASTGWRVESVQINYEEGDLRCDHSGERIPSAYAEPEEDAA